MSELVDLDLQSTKITNKSVDTIVGFSQLSKLNVAGTQLDDDAAEKLKTLPNLRWINVNNSRIGYAGVDALLEAHEGLEVIE